MNYKLELSWTDRVIHAEAESESWAFSNAQEEAVAAAADGTDLTLRPLRNLAPWAQERFEWGLRMFSPDGRHSVDITQTR